jgi:hypothetical protein
MRGGYQATGLNGSSNIKHSTNAGSMASVMPYNLQLLTSMHNVARMQVLKALQRQR